MRKRLFPLLAGSFCIALLFTGCSQRTSPVMRGGDGLTYSITDWNTVDFADPINPYDSFGLQHNHALSYVLTNLGSQTAPGYQDLYLRSDTLGVRYADSIYGYSSSHDSAVLHQARWAMSHVDSLILASGLSGAAETFVDRIDTILMDTTSLADQVTRLRVIDTEALSLAPLERITILVTAAVARYSIAYWRSPDSIFWLNRDSAFGSRPIEYLSAKHGKGEIVLSGSTPRCMMGGKGDRTLVGCGCSHCSCRGNMNCPSTGGATTKDIGVGLGLLASTGAYALFGGTVTAAPTAAGILASMAVASVGAALGVW